MPIRSHCSGSPEVTFAGSALVVVLDDGLLGVVPVIGQDAPVHIFSAEETVPEGLDVHNILDAVSSREVAAKQ